MFINKCLGKIRRIWWPKRIRNEELWRQEGQQPIEEEIKKKTNTSVDWQNTKETRETSGKDKSSMDPTGESQTHLEAHKDVRT